ncbi:MAG: hypothetical protein R3D83_05760 [Caenibius sp.]
MIHALIEDMKALQGIYNVQYLKGSTLTVRPTNEYGEDIRVRRPTGGPISDIDTHHYRPPAKITSCEAVMKMPHYINLEEARDVLAEMGVTLSDRQIKRAADKDAQGRRRLPFFVDPIDGRLKIEKGTLVSVYRKLQIEAEKNAKNQ